MTAVRPGALKLKVRLPVDPEIARFVKLASPSVPEVAVMVPLRVPPPEAIAAVTVIPPTGLSQASRTRMTGCWAKGTPLCAELEGWVLMLSWLALPAVMVIGLETELT